MVTACTVTTACLPVLGRSWLPPSGRPSRPLGAAADPSGARRPPRPLHRQLSGHLAEPRPAGCVKRTFKKDGRLQSMEIRRGKPIKGYAHGACPFWFRFAFTGAGPSFRRKIAETFSAAPRGKACRRTRFPGLDAPDRWPSFGSAPRPKPPGPGSVLERDVRARAETGRRKSRSERSERLSALYERGKVYFHSRQGMPCSRRARHSTAPLPFSSGFSVSL